jgi:hypothetical protein
VRRTPPLPPTRRTPLAYPPLGLGRDPGAAANKQVCQGAEDVSWHAEAEVAHDLKQVIIKMRAQPYVSQVGGRGPPCFP